MMDMTTHRTTMKILIATIGLMGLALTPAMAQGATLSETGKAGTGNAGTGKAGTGTAETDKFETGKPEASLKVLTSEPLQLGERLELHSAILGETVTMNVALPEDFAVSSSSRTYPVIFSNGAHGEKFFAVLAGLVKHLGERERMPESIVVSLNDMGPIPEIHSNGMWSREKLGPWGDPDAGLRHLAEEVFPLLERRYRANDYRILIGVSGSTLFPIHTFLAAPGLFRSHVLVAAADTIGMGYRAEETFIDAFESAFTADPDRRALLYLGTAESDLTKRDDYRANLAELEKRLGRFGGLDVQVDIFERTDHYTVFIESVLAAFDQNFPFEEWTARYRDIVAQPGDALENIDRYYERLSERYGFTILPRADRWNNVNSLRFMTRHLIGEGRAAEALAVARRRLEFQPTVAGTHTGLADALEANGLLADAVKAQAEALRLAREADLPLEHLEKRLSELKARQDDE